MSRFIGKGYLKNNQTVKIQANLHIRAVSPESLLFAQTIKGTIESFRQWAEDLDLLYVKHVHLKDHYKKILNIQTPKTLAVIT